MKCKLLPEPWYWEEQETGVVRLYEGELAIIGIGKFRLYRYADKYIGIERELELGETKEQAKLWVETMIATGAV